MKDLIIFLLSFAFCFKVFPQIDTVSQLQQNVLEQKNKEIATNFYKDLWFTNNTQNYKKYVADTYVVHDIGDRKGVTEPAIEQKIIADQFWENGTIEPTINYQIAEGDLVATRWEVSFKPETLLGRVMYGSGTIPIINVFRIKDSKIVEVWNHRHDIDTNQTMKYTFQGVFIGLLIALIPTIIAARLKRKLNRVSVQNSNI